MTLTGVWTQTPVGGGHTLLETFYQDGTELADQQRAVLFDPVQSTMQGNWKKISLRTFISSCLQLEYNHDKDSKPCTAPPLCSAFTLYIPPGTSSTVASFVMESL